MFPFPAVWNSSSWWLWALWLFALSLSLGLVVVLALLGKRHQHRNAVADPPTLRWSDLGFEEETGTANEHAKANETAAGSP